MLSALRISIKANCVDSTAAPEAVFASEIDKLRKDGVKPKEKMEKRLEKRFQTVLDTSWHNPNLHAGDTRPSLSQHALTDYVHAY